MNPGANFLWQQWHILAHLPKEKLPRNAGAHPGSLARSEPMNVLRVVCWCVCRRRLLMTVCALCRVFVLAPGTEEWHDARRFCAAADQRHAR